MATKEQISAPVESHQFTEEEIHRMELFLDVLNDRIEIIQWLDDYAYFFPDWLKIITNGIFSEIKKKQALNLSCEEEEETLNHVSFFFTKMAYFSGVLSEWDKELTMSKENMEKMIEKVVP